MELSTNYPKKNSKNEDFIENVVLLEDNKKIYSFEEALEKAGQGKFHIFVLLLSGASLTGLVTELLNIGFVGSLAKCDLRFTTAQQGLLNSIAFLGIVLSSHFWGFLADTWGRQKVLKIALLTSFLCSLLSSCSVSIEMFIVTRFFVGFCISGVQASSLTYLGEFHTNKTRARALTIGSMFMTLATVYMSVLAWFILPLTFKWYFGPLLTYSSWRLNILACSTLNLVAFIGLLFLPESSKFLLAMNKKDEAIEVLKVVYQWNTKKPKDSFPVTDIYLESIGSNLAETKFRDMGKLVWKQTWPLFMPPHLKNTLLMCYLSFVCFTIAHGMNVWMPHIYAPMVESINRPISMCNVILNAIVHKSNSSSISSPSNMTTSALPSECLITINPLIYKILLINGISFMLIYIFVAIFIRRIGIKLMLICWLCTCAVTGLSIVWIENIKITFGLIIILLSSGNCGSLLGAIAQDLFPTNIKAMAICFIFMMGRTGGVVGSNIFGLFISNNNCNVIFYLYAGMLFTCAILCFFIPKTSASKQEK